MPDSGKKGDAAFFKRPLSAMLLSLLGRLQLKLLLLYVVRLDGIPDVSPGCRTAEVILAGPENLGELLPCMDKKEKFLKRFMQGDYCVMARENGRAAGYLWFCVKESCVEEMSGYEIKIPPGAVYCYDEYVSPECRKRGIFRGLYRAVACWMKEHGKGALLSIISHDNELSRNIHRKLGFRAVRRILYLKLFGFRYLRESGM